MVDNIIDKELLQDNSFTISRLIILVCSSLLAIGLIFVISAVADIQRAPGLTKYIYPAAALIVLLTLSRLPYSIYRLPEKTKFISLTPLLLLTAIILLVLADFTPLGSGPSNARRWIRIPLGSMSIMFQPSELAKWSLIIFQAAFLHLHVRDDKKLSFTRFAQLCIVSGIVILLILLNDFGTAAFLSIMTGIMLLLGGASILHCILSALAVIPVLIYYIAKEPYRINRLLSFLHPEKADPDLLYQTNRSLQALGSGGLWGKGIGCGTTKWGHLPVDSSDFIFAVIGEEAGLIGTTLVLFLFLSLAVLGFITIFKCRDRFGKLLAAGITIGISIQAAMNIGVVINVLPNKGIPLPLVSAGGTSILTCAAAAAILTSIAAQQPEKQETA